MMCDHRAGLHGPPPQLHSMARHSSSTNCSKAIKPRHLLIYMCYTRLCTRSTAHPVYGWWPASQMCTTQPSPAHAATAQPPTHACTPPCGVPGTLHSKAATLPLMHKPCQQLFVLHTKMEDQTEGCVVHKTAESHTRRPGCTSLHKGCLQDSSLGLSRGVKWVQQPQLPHPMLLEKQQVCSMQAPKSQGEAIQQSDISQGRDALPRVTHASSPSRLCINKKGLQQMHTPSHPDGCALRHSSIKHEHHDSSSIASSITDVILDHRFVALRQARPDAGAAARHGQRRCC